MSESCKHQFLHETAEGFCWRCRIAELEAEKADLIKNGWRSCIDHIIKPEDACPVCKLARVEWQPIETAPKDGTWVLLAFPSESMIAKWLDNSESRIPAALWVVPSMIIRPKGEPTHWQPLPTPPDQQEQSDV